MDLHSKSFGVGGGWALKWLLKGGSRLIEVAATVSLLLSRSDSIIIIWVSGRVAACHIWLVGKMKFVIISVMDSPIINLGCTLL